MIDRFKLDRAVEVAPLRDDLTRLACAGWTPHFNTGYYSGDWSGIVLRGPGGSSSSLYTGAPDAAFEDTAAMSACPAIASFLDSLECPKQSVRLLRLTRGSTIREHSDYGLGAANGEVRLHIPLITHPDVEFYVSNHRVHMAAGEIWYLDLGNPHWVRNNSPVDRIHLVVDVVVNDWLRGQIPFFDADPRMAGVAEATATLSPEESLANWDRFTQAIFDDAEAYATLARVLDRQLFLREAMRLSVALGHPVTEATLTQTMAKGRSAWMTACVS